MPPKWIKDYKKTEKKLFNYFIYCLGTEESGKQLTESILEDPTRPETQILCFLHSMEPSFYAELNQASV